MNCGNEEILKQTNLNRLGGADAYWRRSAFVMILRDQIE